MNSKKIVAFAFGVLVPVLVASDGVAAPNKAAFKHCRLTVGRPTVSACMRSGQGDFQSCRQRAVPAFKRCMMGAAGMAGGPMQGGMAGRGRKIARCKALAYQRGLTGAAGKKDQLAIRGFVRACVQGKQF